MRISGGYASDIGRCRKVNQDAVFYRRLQQRKEDLILCAVCDGVGGLEHGEIASNLLVSRMREWFEKTATWIDIAGVDTGVLFSHLKDAAEGWNEELCRFRQMQNLRTGSTMSMLLLVRDFYYIIHVGDSRIYRYREGVLEQLTVDACVTRIKTGHMKNYLDNYMGKEEPLWFQSVEGRVKYGDLFVVCSDGLYHNLSENDISELYLKQKKKKNWNIICIEMIQQMIERGESDNISICVVMAEKEKQLFRYS